MKKFIYILILAFVLNFIWEISQAFLYMPHYIGIDGLVKIHIKASLGDMLIMSIIFLLSYIVSGYNFFRDKYNTKSFLSLIIIGFTIAVLVEKYSLAVGRWQYNSMMPIIPLLRVGLTPILQMTLIPTITMLLFSSLVRNKQ